MPTSRPGTGGGWGSNLSSYRFARALAAAGVLTAVAAARASHSAVSAGPAVGLLRQELSEAVLEESPLLRWMMPLDDSGLPPSWMPPPDELDLIWKQAIDHRREWFEERLIIDGEGRTRHHPPATGLRLEVPSSFSFLRDAAASLVSHHTGIESIAALAERKTKRLEWNWPIKVQVVSPGRPNSSALETFRKQVIELRDWLSAHLVFVPEDSDDRADFAMVFATVPSDHYFPLKASGVNADCVILVSRVEDASDVPSYVVNAQLRRVRASGLVLQPGMHPTDNVAAEWMLEFVRQLSHAVTIDVAAIRAARRAQVMSPTVRLSRALLDQSHVSRRHAMILSSLRRAGRATVVRDVPDAALQALRLGASVTARALAEALKSRVTPFDFGRESKGAHIIAALAAVVDTLPMEAPRAALQPLPGSVPYRDSTGFSLAIEDLDTLELTAQPARYEPSDLRFLQAQLLVPHEGRLIEPSRALDSESECLVRVRIGGEDREWPSFGDRTFPTEELPPTDKGWLLEVYLFTSTGEQPQHSQLFLPAKGDSQYCEFVCGVGDGSRSFRARMVVAYGNRVLQSAWLEAPVQDDTGVTRGAFERGLEVVVRPHLSGLDGRSEFGAFIVLNDSLTQGPGVAIGSGTSAVLRTPPDIHKTIDFIDGELTKISNKPELYGGGLESKSVATMLRSLAQYGSLMYAAIVEDQAVDKELIDAERVQVVAAESWSRLPIEFFYDQPAPDPKAPLCPGAAKCLRGAMAAGPGPCNDACPAGATGSQVVCPRGFWGLRKVIEWHRHSGDKASGGDFQLQSEPDSKRKSIKAFQSVLFAHSVRVDAHYAKASADVLAALNQASSQTNTANDWTTWRAGISSHSPLLMLVLPHNQLSVNKLPELSIGKGTQAMHRLLLSSIDDTVVKGPNTSPGAIVMLLGCETGAPKTSYLDYVAQFRRRGASIILSTGATVLGRQISPICVRLIQGLQAAVAKGPAPLGEVMLQLRREALADGFPIVLALSASGDADWLIE